MTTYDFIWQSASPGEPFALEPFVAALNAAGATQRPDGALVWKLPAGEVTCTRVREAGAPAGIDVRVPLSDRTELLADVVRRGLELAAANGARFIDPLLGEPVRLEAFPAIEASFLRVASYAGKYIGVSDAVGAGWDASMTSRSDEPTPVWLFALIVFLVAAFVAYRLAA